MTGGCPRLTESPRYAHTLAKTLFAASLALLHNCGACRHREREGITHLHTPEALGSHGQDEYLARIRPGPYPVGR